MRLKSVMTICCQDVRAPCSLHVRPFPPLFIVFCYNNDLAVYPRGDFGVQTHEVTPPSLLIIITDSIRKMLHLVNGFVVDVRPIMNILVFVKEKIIQMPSIFLEKCLLKNVTRITSYVSSISLRSTLCFTFA